MSHTVQVIRTATGEVVKSVPCSSEAEAITLEAGIDRNMDAHQFHTKIVAPSAVES